MEKIHIQKQITQQIKKEMLFLQRYAEELRLHSVLYEEDGRHLQIEDELVDYLHYTRSVLDLRNDCKQRKEPVLKAMEQRNLRHLQKQSRDHHAYQLLQTILQLPKQEKDLLLDMYVRGLDRRIILLHQGDIVESTLYRRLQRAYQHVYELLRYM